MGYPSLHITGSAGLALSADPVQLSEQREFGMVLWFVYLDADWKVVRVERLKMCGLSEVCALHGICSVMAPAAAACRIAEEQG